jgi:hypothetical protein
VLIVEVLPGVFVEVRIIKELADEGDVQGVARIVAFGSGNGGGSRFPAVQDVDVSGDMCHGSTDYRQSQHLFTVLQTGIDDSKRVLVIRKGRDSKEVSSAKGSTFCDWERTHPFANGAKGWATRKSSLRC